MNEKHLASLSIRNYRSLDSLDIDRLGRVNLVVGPNNIGKSSLLEAILLWGTKLHILTLRDILTSRAECHIDFPDRLISSPFLGVNQLFSGCPPFQHCSEKISVSNSKETIQLYVACLPDDPQAQALGLNFGINIPGFPRGLMSVNSELVAQVAQYDSLTLHYLNHRCIYLSPNVIHAARVPLSKLWEQVEISRWEKSVIDSLRLIEEKIEKIFFIGSARIPVCRLKGRERPVPLHGMGDGVSRLFELTLGLVNVAGGICLIDEFENGLHWMVQEQVWDVVFQTAKNLDVQIFATTHSLDAVKAFQKVALRQEDKNFGGIVQMKKQNDKTIAKSIFGEDIRKVLQYEVEVR